MDMFYTFRDERFIFIGIKHVYLHQHSFTFSLLIQFDDILLRTYLVSKPSLHIQVHRVTQYCSLSVTSSKRRRSCATFNVRFDSKSRSRRYKRLNALPIELDRNRQRNRSKFPYNSPEKTRELDMNRYQIFIAVIR